MNLRPADVLTLLYLLFASALVLSFPSRVPAWYEILFFFGLTGIAIIVLAMVPQHLFGKGYLVLIRFGYPLAAATFFYKAAGSYVLVLQGRFLDEEFSAWEASLIGRQPYAVLSNLVSRPLTEFMMLNYFSFYLYFLVPPLLLFRSRRIHDLEEYVFTVMLSLYVCYLSFVLVPVVGPSLYPLEVPHLSGYLVTPLQYNLMQADARGTTFPSAHVAGAWTALLCIGRFFGRRAFWLVLPYTFCLTVAVVYTRFHYVADAVGGLVVASVCYAIATGLYSSSHNKSEVEDHMHSCTRG